MLLIGKALPRKNKGFTFIELALVAIIILVLAGLTPPIFRKSVSSIRLKTAAQEMVQLMRYARARALAQRRRLRINFDFEPAAYWLSAQDEKTPEEYKRITGRWGRTFRLPNNVSIDLEVDKGRPGLIVFYPDATSDAARVKISDQNGRGFQITTHRKIGYAEITQ